MIPSRAPVPAARRLRRALLAAASATALALAAALVAAPPAAAAPVLFPETPDGGPPEWRDERDVAPYLAAWKAEGLRRARRLATPATANQLAWDARFYDLDLAFNPTTRVLTGTVGVRATVVTGPLTTLDLDFAANMAVDAVTAGGAPSTYSRAGDVLTVQLDRAYGDAETVEVTVTYHGTPLGGALNFDTYNGRTMIWSLSEPFGARTWWPCKDAPEDKADSVDVRITTPAGLIAASNGTLVETTDNGVTAVTRWQERYPITTYLVSVAIHNYTVTQDWYVPSPADSMPIRFHMFPESAAGAAAVHAKVKDMIAAFAARYGEYPFLAEKYGHAECLFGGGMEHQTCTSLGTYLEYIVAHELGHQWWGDWVTCRDFHHVWINEGFATYSEALWAEAQGGAAAYHADLAANRYFGAGSIYVPDLSSVSRIFDSNLSYNKGSWVLHMLRRVLGDAVFFDALRAFGTQYAYSVATTEDFRDVCEAVSGRDLDAFFQQWIYGEYYPQYRMTYASTPAGGGFDVQLTVEQTQPWQLFNMPLDVRVSTALGDRWFVVRDSLASQTFTLHVDAAPTAVALDPENWVLKSVENPVVSPAFDRSVLLVNGVEWATYGTEITSAYANRAFWGDYAVDFWDVFTEPAGGYPGTLPAPLGHGAVPPEIMGRYRVVIWVGNNYGGDLADWLDSPIQSYLERGGNVLLMTRMGDQFLTDPLRSYLGITFAAGTQLYDCVATRPGLTNVGRIGTQNSCVVFDTTRAHADSDLLYKVDVNYNPDRGIGVLRRPAGGAGLRPHGGRFIFLSGRPYRWDALALRSNVMAMLADRFLEPRTLIAVEGPAPGAARAELAPAYPNPFAGATVLRFALPRAAEVRLEVLDLGGRRVRTLHDGPLGAGPHERAWDGRDDRGHALAAGIYWTRLATPDGVVTRKVVRVR